MSTEDVTYLDLEELTIVEDQYQYRYRVLRPTTEGRWKTLATYVGLAEAVAFAEGYEAARKETA